MALDFFVWFAHNPGLASVSPVNLTHLFSIPALEASHTPRSGSEPTHLSLKMLTLSSIYNLSVALAMALTLELLCLLMQPALRPPKDDSCSMVALTFREFSTLFHSDCLTLQARNNKQRFLTPHIKNNIFKIFILFNNSHDVRECVSVICISPRISDVELFLYKHVVYLCIF